MAIITPKRHHSIVPAVVGDTKRLLVMRCMIKPLMARLLPTTRMPQRRGMRLCSMISHQNCSCSPSIRHRSDKDT